MGLEKKYPCCNERFPVVYMYGHFVLRKTLPVKLFQEIVKLTIMIMQFSAHCIFFDNRRYSSYINSVTNLTTWEKCHHPLYTSSLRMCLQWTFYDKRYKYFGVGTQPMFTWKFHLEVKWKIITHSNTEHVLLYIQIAER